jgi:hypothetical protein
VRIAVASSVLLTLSRISHGHLVASPTLYRPVGIWMLLGAHPPSPLMVDLLWGVAWPSSFAMLVGLAARLATIASFVSGVSLASLVFAANSTWSHQYNIVFLAQLALFGARSGHALSVDALIRRPEVAHAYQWSLRLVQLAVALMFVSAVFHKLLFGHFTLRWAFSDNLRNQLLVRFDLAHLPRPALASWLIDHPCRYRTAALLNMISQAAPLLAIVHVRRPRVRAVAGLFFVIETISLGLVVDLWNLHWLPLAAVFIDWEHALGCPVDGAPPVPPRRAVRMFIAAFVAYDLLTAFVPRLDQRLNTYPFSGFPMFAKVRARPPYHDHQAYSLPGVSFEVTAERPIDAPLQSWFDHAHRDIETVRDPVALRRELTAILAEARRAYPGYRVRSLRVWLTIFEAPAYPAPAHLERHPIAILGEVAPDGSFRSQLGATRELHAPAGSRVIYYRDNVPTPYDLGPTTADRSRVLDGNPVDVVVIVDGAPWLVASYARWEW